MYSYYLVYLAEVEESEFDKQSELTHRNVQYKEWGSLTDFYCLIALVTAEKQAKQLMLYTNISLVVL